MMAGSDMEFSNYAGRVLFEVGHRAFHGDTSLVKWLQAFLNQRMGPAGLHAEDDLLGIYRDPFGNIMFTFKIVRNDGREWDSVPMDDNMEAVWFKENLPSVVEEWVNDSGTQTLLGPPEDGHG